jgi:hypothetical protein
MDLMAVVMQHKCCQEAKHGKVLVVTSIISLNVQHTWHMPLVLEDVLDESPADAFDIHIRISF